MIDTKSKKLDVTAVIIAKNESDMIANCIDTVRWCDHILVIDDNSTDGTDDIAQNAGAKVISFSSPSFAERRNRGLKAVKTEWVLFIDADERITPRLFQEIAVHLETNTAAAIGFSRQNICYGAVLEHGGWENDTAVRLFKRDALKGWTGEIHESPEFEGEVTMMHTPLLHLTHRSVQDGLIKSATWTKQEAELLAESGVPPVTLFTLLRKGIMEFIRRAYFKEGRKDGMTGIIEAVIQGINRMLVYAQVWEFQQQPPIPEKYQRIEKEIAAQWKHHKS